MRRFTDERALEIEETKELYESVRRAHRKSRYANPDYLERLNVELAASTAQRLDNPPSPLLLEALTKCQGRLLALEDAIFQFPAVNFNDVLSAKELLDLRRFLRAKEHFLANEERVLRKLLHAVTATFEYLTYDLTVGEDDGAAFTVPLIATAERPADIVECTIGTFVNDPQDERDGLFAKLRRRFYENICGVHGVIPDSDHKFLKITASAMEGSPAELVEKYLAGTPFHDLLLTPVPLTIPQSTRFEHHWIVAGSGHGKTQTLQYLISKDLDLVREDRASIIVIDSQGDLIRTLSRLQFFSDFPEKLCLIDPTDIEYPVALNLFDLNMDRMQGYSPLDRERLTNSILELYDFVIGSLLSAELTQKQNVMFRYITRLLLYIPDANIQTLRELMEPTGYEKYQEHIRKLQGTARAFFETEFRSKQFEETKRQVVRRLWGILENQTFEQMFSHPRNKLDLFSEMNSGKVILINTAKDLLKQNGTEIFGRFFIAMIAQCAQERSTLPQSGRLPCFVYIDEAQDYIANDANVTTILEQARKQNVGLTISHQYLGQISQRNLDSLYANTSIKMAGGVSDRDAHALARNMRTTPDFIVKQPKGHFAAHVRNASKEALSLRVPFGVVEDLPRMLPEEWEWVREKMRERYAVHYDEVRQVISEQLGMAESVRVEVEDVPIEPVREVNAEIIVTPAPNNLKRVEPKKPKDPDDVDTKPSDKW